MKRKSKDIPVEESDDSEIDVDDEEKDGHEEDSDDEEELEDENNDVAKSAANNSTNTFLDTFYGLSSNNPRERAISSQAMLNHCLIGPDANTKDASYALKRLMNGVCSGRAAARQGNASALASFLKLAFTDGKLHEIQLESRKEGDEELSDLAFVRQRLIQSTHPGETSGKRKGSEERDYRFGRLFGILSIIRSGILIPSDRAESEDIVSVTLGLANDLVELYRYKKWIREPAAQAIIMLLTMFYGTCEHNVEARDIVESVVKEVLLPELLANGDNATNQTTETLLATYSAEQIAVALTIQANFELHKSPLPSPLNESILSKETIPLVASALSETSTVTQPRTHLVWDTLWMFTTKTEGSKYSKLVDNRVARERCPVNGDSVEDVVSSIFKHVVTKRLLGIGVDSTDNGKTTHERRSLAICLVRNLCGVEFVSSVTGRTILWLNHQIIENVVLSSLITKRLFLDVIAAGAEGKKQQGNHLLKPLATKVLESICESLDIVEDPFSEEHIVRRMAFVRSFLCCESRFDSRTKLRVIATLTGMDASIEDHSRLDILSKYKEFLEISILRNGGDNHQVIGFIDLLLGLCKKLLQTTAVSEESFVKAKQAMSRQILHFFFITAFFDFRIQTKKVKARGHPMLDVLSFIRFNCKEKETPLPVEVREVLSTRFASVLAATIGDILRRQTSDKEQLALELLASILNGWEVIESAGATLHRAISDDHLVDTDENRPHSSKDNVEALLEMCESRNSDVDNIATRAKKRFLCSAAVVAFILYLQLLKSGSTTDFEIDDDDDEDREEVNGNIAELRSVIESFTSQNKDENPLVLLTDFCSHMFTSARGSGSTPLVRLEKDAVKELWLGGLYLLAFEPEKALFNSEVITTLMESIGVTEPNTSDSMDIEDDPSSVESEPFASDEEEFNKLQDVNDYVGEEHSDGENTDESAGDAEEEDDVPLDPTKLQTMLEEESEAEIEGDELEHHAGADKALAKLIKIRQEARKAGKLAHERSEINGYIRSIVLLETVLLGKSESWGKLLKTESLLHMVLPLIQYRNRLEKSIDSGKIKGLDSLGTEKRVLVEKLTSLLKTKLFKTKISSISWNDPSMVRENISDISHALMEEARKRGSKEHRSCCSIALNFILRSTPSFEMKLHGAKSYAIAIEEWCRVKSTRLDSSLFEDLIHHHPVLAQACLVKPLASASPDARSTFLKSEALRLLSLLYNKKLNPELTEDERLAISTIDQASNDVLSSMASALDDSEMRKSKRARETLKAIEKILSFYEDRENSIILQSSSLEKVKHGVSKLKNDSESQGVTSMASRVIEKVDNLMVRNDRLAYTMAEAKESSTSSGKKKKSKKKKK